MGSAVETSDRQPAPALEGGLVPAVHKAVAVVRHVNGRAPAGATLGEIAGALGITRSHCHNILRTLVACDWMAYDPLHRVYRIATGVVADTSAALNRGEPISDLRPVLTRLAREVRLLCILTRLEPDGSFIVVDKVDGAAELGLSVPVAHRFPPDAPAQCKATLAWREPAEIEAWLERWQPVPYTEVSIVDKKAMAAQLVDTRRRGHSLSVDEYITGVTSIGLPIFDRDGQVAFVLQCPGLSELIVPQAERIATAMHRAVAQIHRQIDARTPPAFQAVAARFVA